MKIQVNWVGFYIQDTEVEVKGTVEVDVNSALEALNAARGPMIEKLAGGSKYGVKHINLHRVEKGPLDFSMDALNDFVQSFNAEGGTDSIKRVRPKGYTITFAPDGTANIQTGMNLKKP